MGTIQNSLNLYMWSGIHSCYGLHCLKSRQNLRHNGIHDHKNNLLDEVSDDVEFELCLWTLQGYSFANRNTRTEDLAKMGIRLNGL